MELRVLQYFLAVAREQSILGASAFLHLSQPTLSRQLRDLEEELGKQLFIRGSRKITLTNEGMIFRKRAEEILDLVKKTERELASSEETVAGDILIGTGETDAVRLVARVVQKLQNAYPKIHLHITSGDSVDIMERLDKGLYDFAILLGEIDLSRYNHLKFPVADEWGVLMRKDAPLADQKYVCAEDLWDKPLILSRQGMKQFSLPNWIKKDAAELNVIATYNLIFNASLMVDEGMGYAVTLNKLINTTGESNLCFKPLYPRLEMGLSIVWKKYQIFSSAAEKFLEAMQSQL